MNNSDNKCLFVLLGARGDLAKRKIIPAFFRLLESKKLDCFYFVGVSRSNTSAKEIVENSKKFIKNYSEDTQNEFLKRFSYFSADLSDEKSMKSLGDYLEKISKENNITNRIFYLATPPEQFDVAVKNMKKFNLCNNNSKVAFEKPFGYDLSSAKKIDKCIKSVFDEKQIFRIDHYLAKEIIKNIEVLRFTNSIFEPLWNKDHIDNIQVIMSESLGVEDRGSFYDNIGAIKDYIQNHALQLISLIAMDSPTKLFSEELRDEKFKVLKKARIEKYVLGQYDSYLSEKDVSNDSRTETFVALKLFIDNKRWQDVPFYVMHGKAMKSGFVKVNIVFKRNICKIEDKCACQNNILTINVQPNAGISLQINGKSPSSDIVPLKLDFAYSSLFVNTPEAYETLILEIIAGNNSVFVRSDEILQQWKIVDKMLSEKKINPNLEIYSKGSYPKTADSLVEEDNRRWIL